MENKRMPMWRKLGYGVGGFGQNIGFTTVASFIMMYCTNVLGVSAAVIGTLMMFSRFLDGVSDVLMGTIIDHTKSKSGKARFWYIVSALPVALCVFLIFNVPAGFSETTKYIYFFLVYTALSVIFYTMSNISYMTMLALVSKDQKDQTDMSSFQMIFSMLAVLVLSYTTMALVEVFGGGYAGWRMTGLIFAVLTLITLLVPAFCVRELPESIQNNGAAASSGKTIGFFASLKYLLTHKYFLILLGINFINYFASGITGSTGSYFAVYVLNNPMALGTLSLTTTLPIILFMPFIPPIIAKIGDMRKATLYGAVFAVLGSIVIFVGGKAGFGVLLIGMIIKGIASLPGGACLGPMTAASVENLYQKSGHYLTGSFFACGSVGNKIGMGLGTAVCGFMLESSGFDGMAAIQTSSALDAIRLLYTAVPLIAAVITFVLWFIFDVEKKNAEIERNSANK